MLRNTIKVNISRNSRSLCKPVARAALFNTCRVVPSYRGFASEAIPKVQKALVTRNRGPDYHLELVKDYPVPQPGPKEILVKLTHSGICHSDLSIVTNHWKGLPVTCEVAGHEGIGRIVGWGSDVDKSKFPEGLRVGVPLTKDVCHHCESCLTPDGEVYCDNVKFYALTENGSFQEYVAVSTEYMVTVPEELPGAMAAPLLCGGVTAYKGIKKSDLKPGEYIVVMGAGGGLGSMAMFYAKVAGLRIIAIDQGQAKKDSCLKQGAEIYIDALKTPNVSEEVFKHTKRGAHGAVVFTPVIEAYNSALSTLGKHGVLVCVGIPNMDDNLDFKPAMAVFNNIRTIGSLVGSRKDLRDCLEIANRFNIDFPVKEVAMDEAPQVLKDMADKKLIGRASIKF